MADADTAEASSRPLSGASHDLRIDLDVAGIALSLISSDPTVIERLRKRFLTALVPDPSDQPFTLRIERRDGPYHDDPGGKIIVNPEYVETGEPDNRAWFDFRSRTGEFHTDETRAWADRTLEFIVEVFLRLVVSIEVVNRGGILLHSSSAIRDDLAYIFFGPSGAGKSTTAASSHSLGYTIPSDDQNVLRIDDGRVVLHGVPFHGLYCPVETKPAIAPVGGIYYLRQDTRDYLEAVPPAVGAAMLVEQTIFVNYHPILSDRVMEICYEIARLMPPRILHLRKGPEFWQIL